MARNNKFRAGEGSYKCQCCDRMTRDTINSAGCFCEQCEELLMLQNSHWDGCYSPGVDIEGDEQRDKWIAIISKRGGNVDKVKTECAAIFPL